MNEQRPGTTRSLTRRARALMLRINVWLFSAHAWIYAAAGSFIGFEGVAVWLSFIALWPIAIPLMIAGIAVVGVVVQRYRDRTSAHDGAGTSGGADGNRTRVISLED